MIKSIKDYYKPVTERINKDRPLVADVKVTEKEVGVTLRFWLKNIFSMLKTKKKAILFNKYFNIFPNINV